eukprot:9467584-Pyramimonas_sp.AAC.2
MEICSQRRPPARNARALQRLERGGGKARARGNKRLAEAAHHEAPAVGRVIRACCWRNRRSIAGSTKRGGCACRTRRDMGERVVEGVGEPYQIYQICINTLMAMTVKSGSESLSPVICATSQSVG